MKEQDLHFAKLAMDNMTNHDWNPMVSDSDAFAMASYMKMSLYFGGIETVSVVAWYDYKMIQTSCTLSNHTRSSAMREAIVKYAIEIGKIKQKSIDQSLPIS